MHARTAIVHARLCENAGHLTNQYHNFLRRWLV
ncbi:MAG: hypothetical protein ACI4VM_04720 [Anaerovoracaceae bacterium]